MSTRTHTIRFFSVEPFEIIYQTCPRDIEKLKERITYNKMTEEMNHAGTEFKCVLKNDILNSKYNI